MPSFPAAPDVTASEQQRGGNTLQGFVADGGFHGLSASTSVSLPSCRAFALDTTAPLMLKGFTETTARTITYSDGDGTYWLGGRATPSVTPGGWTSVPGTHYLWIKNATQPAIPPGVLLLGKVTVSASAITAFTIMAPWRRTTPYSVAAGTTLTFGACPEAGRWQIFDADRVTTGAIEFVGGACREYIPEWFGIFPDGVDHSVNWRAFFASIPVATVENVPLYQSTVTLTPGTYLISGNPAITIPAGMDVHAYGVLFHYGTGDDTAIQIGSLTDIGIGGVVGGFSLKRTYTAGGTMSTNLLGTGIYFVNTSNAVLRDFIVEGFGTGLHVNGLAQACSYNTFQPRQFHNNLVGIWVDGLTGTGFANEGNVYGGRFSTGGVWADVVGSRFIRLSDVDDWRFYGPSLESAVIERMVLMDGVSNFNVIFWARWESQSPPPGFIRLEFTAGTNGNMVFQGDAFTASVSDTTLLDSGTRNTVIGSIQWRLLTDRTILGEGRNQILGTNAVTNDAAVIIGNTVSGALPALGVYTTGGVTWNVAATAGRQGWLNSPGGAIDTALERTAAGTLTVTSVLSATSTLSALGGILGLGGAHILRKGTGDPEGVISAGVGSIFLRTDGGAATTLYVKESGASTTGWVAK